MPDLLCHMRLLFRGRLVYTDPQILAVGVQGRLSDHSGFNISVFVTGGTVDTGTLFCMLFSVTTFRKVCLILLQASGEPAIG